MTVRNTIWKFVLEGQGPFKFDIQQPGLVRHVGVDPQSGSLAFWAQVDPEAPTREMTVQAFGTGWPIPSDAMPLGTAIIGDLVWHLFEVRP